MIRASLKLFPAVCGVAVGATASLLCSNLCLYLGAIFAAGAVCRLITRRNFPAMVFAVGAALGAGAMLVHNASGWLTGIDGFLISIALSGLTGGITALVAAFGVLTADSFAAGGETRTD